jgi:hypothetical protein
MERFMRSRALVTSLAAAAVLVAAPGFAQSPTLAELAKREEARRKAVQAPAKVVTGADVKKGTPAAPATPAAGAPAPAAAAGSTPATATDKPAPATDKPATKPDEPAKDEAYWKDRITQVREELRRNEMFAEALQTRINSLTADFTARDDPYQRARIGEDRVKALAERDRLKTEIELQKKKLDEIQEEARRAGVPPGWVR